MTVTIPTSEAQYGYVVGRVIRALGDTTDADDKPDAVAANAEYKVGDVVDRGDMYYRAKVAHGAAYAGTWGPPLPSVWDVVGPVA